jgi:hypothetical protein
MDKFLKDLQAKSKKLVEIASADDALKQGKKLLKGLKRQVLLKSAIKEMAVFYSEENFNAVKNMIQHDLSIIASPAVKKDALTSAAAINLEAFNFFDIYAELKTQEILKNKYPEFILTGESQSAKFAELMGSLNTLQSKLSAYASKAGQVAQFNSKLATKNREIKDYNDLISLIK